MKKYFIGLSIAFTASLYGGQNPFSTLPGDIIESRAEVVLDRIKKKMDRSALEIGAELAHKVLKERVQLTRTAGDWIWGAIGLAGILWIFYEKAPWYKYVSPIIFGNLIYAYWWRGPINRLNRAQLIADVFDRELGIMRDPGEQGQAVDEK